MDIGTWEVGRKVYERQERSLNLDSWYFELQCKIILRKLLSDPAFLLISDLVLILSGFCPRGIFINQSKYALESLKKYGFESCDPVDTPMVEKSKLDENKEGKAVNPSHYRDADHAGCQDTRRSTSGSVQFMGERLISWSSKRQKSDAISIKEAKYIALSGCCA
nr:retrotransposon protein, putative, Ty1-copia subclass [Tanacetum cinerariifolium]